MWTLYPIRKGAIMAYQNNNNRNNNSYGRSDFRSSDRPFNSRNDRRNSYDRRDAEPEPEVEVGQRFPLTIKRLGINGEGIGYYKRKITFIPGALPDEVVIAEVTKVHPKYLSAKIHKIREASPDRVDTVDEFAGVVGGFDLEHMNYDAQLKFKVDVILQSLEKFKPRGYQNYKLLPTIGMDKPFHYRNKAQFPVRMIDGRVATGMFKMGTHELVDLPEVSTQHPATMKAVRVIRSILEDLGTPIYNEEAKSGIVKTIIARVSESTREVQVTLVTNSKKLPGSRKIIEAIHEKLPEVTSINQNINPGETSLIWGDETVLLDGNPYITETINGKQFQLSPRAFLQLNPKQTARLYNEAISALDLTHADNLIDAYSGVGTLGISLADKAGFVRGMDTIAESIDDANRNAELNGITNARYEVGAAEDLIPQWIQEGWRPDALIVDPPRTGLDEYLRDAILAVEPEKFVYISCNPSTLARDLVDLVEVYNVEYIQSIDMFPQTSRVEAIVKFTRRH